MTRKHFSPGLPTLVYLCLEEHTPGCLKHSASVDTFTSDQFSFNLSEFLSSFRQILKVGADIFAVRMIMGFSLMIYHSNFSLFLEKKFDSSPKMTGWIISFSSLMSVLASFAVGRISSLYSGLPRLLFHTCIVQTITLASMTFAPNIPLFLAGIACISMSNSILRVCITDMSILRCKGEDTGALLGMSQSMMSVARMVAPFMAGLALEVSYSGPGVVASCCGVIGSSLVPLFVMKHKLPPEKKEN
ncbi:Major facilitator superfamily domain-containing protein 9 [Holothuria leucospilota]|uniref:Major facilitator superfamily domain-containing protein 9 n=1 Tax=Holothuria leucospilota TaxID=206669 RepID=A0A9Q0YR58_HOLLE|nr:Major facilitator superfamily domain-containing protein 9 [Holothuria leucospilota]